MSTTKARFTVDGLPSHLLDASTIRIAQEQLRLEVRNELERQDRKRTYQQDYNAYVTGHPVNASGTAARSHLRLLAEGDSWFEYSPLGSDTISKLKPLLNGLPILNLATPGHEAREILGVKQRSRIAKELSGSDKYDALLFSGGGNDIVGEPMCLWIRQWDPRLRPKDHVHSQRFNDALALVRAAYEDLIALRNSHSADTWLFFHGYDFAIPDPKGGVCGKGPWLEPSLTLRGIPTSPDGAAVVKEMLLQFQAMLETVAKSEKNICIVKTQGLLMPNHWDNELHPNGTGFGIVAAAFYDALKTTFPSSVR